VLPHESERDHGRRGRESLESPAEQTLVVNAANGGREPIFPDVARCTNGCLVKEFRLLANFSNDYSLAHPWNTALGYSFREPLREVEKFQFGLELAH